MFLLENFRKHIVHLTANSKSADKLTNCLLLELPGTSKE